MKHILILSTLTTLLFSAVDLNTATQKELVTLKGIGVSKAKAIISYRDKNCFKSVDELTKIKGVGKKLLEKNRDNLTVSECKN